MKDKNLVMLGIDPENGIKNTSISNLGVYIGKDDWTIGRKLIQQLLPKDQLLNFTKKHFINNVNTVYRLPHLTLSRDKVALFAEECNFKVTRKRDIADIVVIGDKTIKKMVRSTYSNSFDFALLKNNYNKGKQWNNLNDKDQDFMHKQVKLIEDLYDDDCIICFESNYYYGSGGNADITNQYRNYLKGLDSGKGYAFYYPKDSFDNMNFVKSNMDKVIFDIDFNLLCTEDSVAIGKEEFKNIYSMIKSGDKENTSVGMTMMANCNIDKSRTYLCLLFAVCSDNMKNSNIWNQVNFKYLRKEFEYYIDIQLSSWGHAYSHLIKRMVTDNCLTRWASSLIASVMFKRVLENHHQVGGKDCVFSLNANDLKLKNEYLVKLVNE